MGTRRSSHCHSFRRLVSCPALCLGLRTDDPVYPGKTGPCDQPDMLIREWRWGGSCFSCYMLRRFLVRPFIFEFKGNIVLAPCSTYSVDIVHTRSAEVMAVNRFILSRLILHFPFLTTPLLPSALRSVLCAITSAGVLPAINKIGIGATNGLTAVLAWFAFG